VGILKISLTSLFKISIIFLEAISIALPLLYVAPEAVVVPQSGVKNVSPVIINTLSSSEIFKASRAINFKVVFICCPISTLPE